WSRSSRCGQRCPRFASVLWTLTWDHWPMHVLPESVVPQQLHGRRSGPFWQKRYYDDRNVRDNQKSMEKLHTKQTTPEPVTVAVELMKLEPPNPSLARCKSRRSQDDRGPGLWGQGGSGWSQRARRSSLLRTLQQLNTIDVSALAEKFG